ncbi:hypothetical protein [Agromyces bauzanensis]
MTVDEVNRPLAEQLNRRVNAHNGWNGVTHGRTPIWYGRMLASLVLAIGSDQVEYFTAGSKSDEAGWHGEVVVFTKSAIVVARADSQLGTDDGEITTTVYSRGDILRFEVSTPESVFSSHAFSEWPGALDVAVFYPDGLTLRLPLERSSRDDHESELYALVSSLRADLSARTTPRAMA